MSGFPSQTRNYRSVGLLTSASSVLLKQDTDKKKSATGQTREKPTI